MTLFFPTTSRPVCLRKSPSAFSRHNPIRLCPPYSHLLLLLSSALFPHTGSQEFGYPCVRRTETSKRSLSFPLSHSLPLSLTQVGGVAVTHTHIPALYTACARHGVKEYAAKQNFSYMDYSGRGWWMRRTDTLLLLCAHSGRKSERAR